MLNKLQIQGRKIGNLSFHHNMLRPVMDSAKINNIFRISKPNLPQAHINLNERWNGGILSHDPELVKNKCETWAALFLFLNKHFTNITLYSGN